MEDKKIILGLDLGTNSIGAAVVCAFPDGRKELVGKPISRIIPMQQNEIDDFGKGTLMSAAASRRMARMIRRSTARFQLRRARLLRVLNVLGFLPKHFAAAIDFEKRMGQFKLGYGEEKLQWDQALDASNSEFVFENEFKVMCAEFSREGTVSCDKKISREWTLYFLRKKALSERVSPEALAWILMSFNAKRGYNMERGDDDDSEVENKEEFRTVEVEKVEFDNEDKNGKKWFKLTLRDIKDGNVFMKPWADIKDANAFVGKTFDIVVTDGEGKSPKVSLLTADKWKQQKEKREAELKESGKTVGEYFFDLLLKNPEVGARKKIRIIGREFYKSEARRILEKQAEFIPELRSRESLEKCVNELYRSNKNHRNLWLCGDKRTLIDFILDDVIFYQRPLKSKKNEIDVCSLEKCKFVAGEAGEEKVYGVRCASRSNPFFAEFRIWKFISGLRIFDENQLQRDITARVLETQEQKVKLFEWLNARASVRESTFLKDFCKFGKKCTEFFEDFKAKAIHWNYIGKVESDDSLEKEYPCNPVRAEILKRFSKCGIDVDLGATVVRNNTSRGGREPETVELALWHVLYSVNDPTELEKALWKFSELKCLRENESVALIPEDVRGEFVKEFVKIKRLEKLKFVGSGYASFSEKALRKLLPLMRCGKYWRLEKISEATQRRILSYLKGGETADDKIRLRAEANGFQLSTMEDFSGLPDWLAMYVVYGRHSEADVDSLIKWNSPEDITRFLSKEFRHNSLRNPVVERVVLEALRVVRDVWKIVDHIDEIHVELGREMALPAQKRRELTAKISINEIENLRIRRILEELKRSKGADNVLPGSPSHQDILKIYEAGALANPDAISNSTEAKSFHDIVEPINKDVKSVSENEIKKYRIWLDGKYRSPYTGRAIPLSKLFTTEYEIEHVIPKSRFFDNSFTNKVICEAAVNKEKGDRLAMEFINEMNGGNVKVGDGFVRILPPDEYMTLVNGTYHGKKKELLLATEIPSKFTNSQLVNTQYIGKYVRNILSRIVRRIGENGRPLEDTAVSANVITCTGTMTDALKRDWGLTDVWNELTLPRFLRMNEINKTEKYTARKREGGGLTGTVPVEQMKGFRKKRIDHRHHAMDAVVIACCTREHVQLMSNESAGTQNKFVDLARKLKHRVDVSIDGKYKKTSRFIKPWKTFTEDVKAALGQMFPTFKKNVRVMSKGRNVYTKLDASGRVLHVQQEKGDIRKIRKPLHKETFFGVTNLLGKETRKLDELFNPDKTTGAPNLLCRVCDKALRKKLIELFADGNLSKGTRSWFKNNPEKFPNVNLNKIEAWVYSEETEDRSVAARKEITPKIKLEKITDESIRRTLENFLKAKDGDPKLAFSREGLEEMNANIEKYTPNGKPHKPIWRVRITEGLGKKFPVGEIGEKSKKFVEAERGTNLFLAVYLDSTGTREFETITLRVALENVRENLAPVSSMNKNKSALLFSVSPGDIVYLPKGDEIEQNGNISPMSIDTTRLFRLRKVDGANSTFMPVCIASELPEEFSGGEVNGIVNFQGRKIIGACLPVKTDRLGNITKVGV